MSFENGYRALGEAAKAIYNAPSKVTTKGIGALPDTASALGVETLRQTTKLGITSVMGVTRMAFGKVFGFGKDMARLGAVAALSLPIIPGMEQTPWQAGKSTLEALNPKKTLDKLEQGGLQRMITQRMTAAEKDTEPLREGLPPDRSPT